MALYPAITRSCENHSMTRLSFQADFVGVGESDDMKTVDEEKLYVTWRHLPTIKYTEESIDSKQLHSSKYGIRLKDIEKCNQQQDDTDEYEQSLQ